nr:Ppx/GppA phosphatase family protein [Oricola thermophila]
MASGSAPSRTGFDPAGSGPAGVQRDRSDNSSAVASGQSARKLGGDGKSSDFVDASQDGRLDHHKEKKGRKRRRRRRGRQKPAAEASVPAGESPPTKNAAEPVVPGSPQRRKRRRGRKKPHVHVSGQDATPGIRQSASVSPKSPTEATSGREKRYPDYYAALDLGTNNCRLLVATPTRPGQFRVVDSFSRIVRLGEGLSRTGRLSEAAMGRAVEALKICRDKLQARQIRRMRLIATEACRAAENGTEFLERVREETGLALEIVDRETEARLAVSGCSSLVGRDTDSVVLFDIGGGSSEIALVDVKDRRSRRLADHIVAWTSLQVGVVTLSEKFDGRHVSPQVFADMTDYATELLFRFEERDRLADRVGMEGFHLLGTSGTVTTLAGIHLDLPKYDRRRVDGLWMTSEEVDAMNARLLSWSFDERVANPCIGADRADLVLAGCAILEAIRRVWPSRRLRVADRGLREGILTEMMAADGVWRRGANPWRNRSQRNGK